MNTKLRALWEDMKQAFIFPFSKDGLRSLLSVCVMLLIPFGWIAGQGLAWAACADRTQRRGISAYIKLGLRISAAGAILAAPVLFLSMLLTAAKFIFLSTPLLFDTVIILLFALALARLVLLLPLATCALAFGMPLREAVHGKTLRLILSGCTGRLLLCGALMFPLVFLAGAIGLLPGPLAYILGAVYGGLLQMIASGLVASCFRRAFGMPPSPPSPLYRGGGFGRRAVAGMLAVLIAFGGQSVAYASPGGIRDEDIVPIQPQDGAAGTGESDDPNLPQTYNEAFRQYTEMGVLGPYTGNALSYDPTMGYTVKPSDGYSQAANDAFVLAVDVITDYIPVVSQIKDTAQLLYYGNLYFDSSDQKTKDAALTSMMIKAGGLASFGAGKFIKHAKLANGSTKLVYIASKYGDKGMQIADQVNKFTTSAETYGYIIEGLRINGTISDREAEALTSSSFINNVKVSAGAIEQMVNDGTDRVRNSPYEGLNFRPAPFGPGYRGPTEAEQSKAQAEIDHRKATLGSYSGKLTGYDYNAYGMTGSLESTDVSVSVTEQAPSYFTASITTNLMANYKYELYGSALSGSSSTPVKATDIRLVRESDVRYSGSQSITVTTTMTNNYAGEGYAAGGGSIDTQSSFNYTVYLALQYVDGKPLISGYLLADTQQPEAGAGYAIPQQRIDFVCYPTD